MSSKKKTNQQSKKPQGSVLKAGPSTVVRQKKTRVSDWAAMVTNPGASKVVRTPSAVPFTGAALSFTRTFEIQASALGGSEFEMIVTPELEKTIRLPVNSSIVMDANSVIAPDGGSSLSVTGIYYADSQALSARDGYIVYDSNTRAREGNFHQAFDSASGLPYIPIALAAGSTVTATVYSNGADPRAIWTALIRNGGNWSAAGSADCDSPVTCNGPFDGLCLVIQYPNTSVYQAKVVMGGPAFPSVPVDAEYDAFSTDAVQLGQVLQYRVTAMSVLATYSGNMFNNGGVIAAARTRPEYYHAGTPFTSLSKLVDHSYTGAMKDGAYAWWLPYDLDEFDFRAPFDYTDYATQLRVAGKFDDPNGSLKVTLHMNVEFYSPLQIFDHSSGPPLTDEFSREFARLDGLPAATCNPSHGDILKGLLKQTKKTVKGAAGYFADHPELAALLLSGLAV